MLSREKFIKFSLETDLFYLRVMKEHLFFIENSLTPVEEEKIKMADLLKRTLEELMNEIIQLSDECISEAVLNSGELVTEYTLEAEKFTSKLTGSSINTDLTKKELDLTSGDCDYNEWLENYLINFNCRVLNIMEEVLSFKEEVLELFLDCKIYVTIYPEMLEHIICETKHYIEILEALKEKEVPEKSLCDVLNFWNHIMKEHGQFIDGMLDPSEKDLKELAERFVHNYEILVKECLKSDKEDILNRSTKLTDYFKDYKTSAVKGLLDCKVRSIIPPLLADHILREANHYLRLLKEYC